jgi:hypothetical protein
MNLTSALPLELMADASAASNAMRAYITPVINSIIAIASIAVVFFLVWGGIQYMVSSGNPEKLEHAKKILKNALIGLVLIVAAGTLTAILSHAYSSSSGTVADRLPQLTEIHSPDADGGVAEVIISGIIGFLRNIVESAAKPFIDALSYFTNSTPLMAENSGVFNLWLTMIAIADVLFVLVIALLGFHIMSFSVFGFEEIDLKQLLPKLALGFLLINTSIFSIDAIVSLSNGMISALHAAFPSQTVWDSLKAVADMQGGFGLTGLLLMIVFVILSVVLLVYYVVRLVTLYIGTVLAPFVILLWLLPPFKDFAESAMKTYIMTIFVLFIHVVILQLASSLFAGMLVASGGQSLNPFMSMIVGIATVVTLLKTQGVLSQMSYASVGPKAMGRVGSKLVNAINYYGSKKTGDRSAANEAAKTPPSFARAFNGNYQVKTPGRLEMSSVPRQAGGKPTIKINMSSKTPSLPIRPPVANIGKTRVAPSIGKVKP